MWMMEGRPVGEDALEQAINSEDRCRSGGVSEPPIVHSTYSAEQPSGYTLGCQSTQCLPEFESLNRGLVRIEYLPVKILYSTRNLQE